MNRLPDIGQVSDLRLGDHPGFDAWFYSFCAENNIEHGINPSGVASPEQLRFMVALDERQVYAPCSDATFRELAASFHLRSFPPRVRSQYIAAWRSIIRVVRYEKDRQKRRDMINYCRHRFRGCLALGNILPSRLVKRLVTTLISHFDAGDPWLNERLFYNETLASFLRSQALQNALGRLPDGLSAEGIPDLRRALDLAELARLFHLAGRSHHTLTQLIHNCAAAESGKCELPDIFTGSEAFIPQVEELFPGPPRTFLYICAMEGGLALDLRIIQTLLRLGHKVILTLKEAPVYYAPTIWDMDRDPLLVDSLPESHLFKAPAASKNELLRRLRENRLLIISDGTGERLNLYRTSVTFARAWKESDAIIARGRCNRDVLLGTSHLFTRDVFCFWEDRGEVRMQLKPHAQDALLFKGSVTWEGDTLALSQCKGKLDATPLRAELRLHFRDVLAMEGSLSLGKLQLDEYLPLPESGKDAGTAKGKEGKAVAAADKESATSWPTINMRLAMSSLGWKKMHLRDISLALSGSKGDYRLTSFQGVLESGGRLSAGGRADLRNRKYALDLDAAEVALGPLQESLEKPRSVEGLAALKASCTTSGTGADAMMAALSGSGDLRLRNMHIPALTSLLHSVPGLKGAVSDTFEQVHVPFVLRKGEADLAPMTATSPKLQARGQAHASLPRQHLKGTATITTLGLNIPVNYEGPFDNLSFSLDSKFALDAVKGLGSNLLEGGKKAGSAAGDTARGAGNSIGGAVRDAGGAIRGLLGR